ncbi:MAG: putative lipid II flippase FtsW [Coxiellaceae bacterium]|nr:putative lipid II flippase FtsW [Coxiellaceae bacterium]
MRIDKVLLVTVLALLVYGLLMVTSASMVISDRIYGYPFHYFFRQAVYIVIGVVLAFFAWRVPLIMWRKASGYLVVLGLVLLVLVLIPGIGRSVNGSRRWINLVVLTLQVSELMKLFMVLYLARYIERFQDEIQTEWKGFIKPLVLMLLAAALLLLEPDFGTAAVIIMTGLVMLYLSGARLLPFVVLMVLVAAGLAAVAVTSPYRLARLTTFLNPWHSPFGAGYQLTQSLIAFGRGGVFGVGLGNSIQKLFYLPEAHTDFVFAVIAEELGLIGELLLMALFVILIVRIFRLAARAYQLGSLFESFMAYGMGTWLGLQAFINMGVNAGILPTKGITLPFISYGGSSMLVNCVVIGILLRLSFELSEQEHEQRTPYVRMAHG